MVTRPAKSPGETSALLTEMDRKMKLVEDVTGEEVSEMHVRSSLVGILDSVTRQHTAMNHSKFYKAFKKIVQEFANNSTTGQEAMHIGRIEAGATAPTTAWPPWVAETSEDSWQECDAINAMGSQQCSICKGYGHVPPEGKGKCKGQHNCGKDRGPHEWSKSNYDGNKGSNDGIYSLSSHGPSRVTASLEVKGELHLRWRSFRARLPKGGGKGGIRALEARETGEEPPLEDEELTV